ncbi:MAG TPA: hypothetical protein VEI96_10990 [Thermodesulfovibrionales bacterium]|nr:hypothetical protein [Thermodesulfovibrionales bacterium]
MYGKTDIRVVLTIAVAALFVLAFAYQASTLWAFEDERAPITGGGGTLSYTGEIVGIDNSYLSVRAAPNDELNFRWDKDVPRTMCNAEPADLHIGDHVTVSYFELGTGGYMASDVISLPSDMDRC